MPLSDARRRSLAQLLDEERSRGLRRHNREPSRFRDTLGDTHRTVPPEYFGPSPDLVPPHFTGSKDYLAMLRASRASRTSRMKQAPAAAVQQDVQHRSVFKPRPEQELACSLAKERRVATANSEWALLDSFETALCNEERDQQRKGKARAAAEMRSCLDAQVREKQELEQRQALTEIGHGEVVQRDVDVAREQDVTKQQRRRDSSIKLKNERLAMIQNVQQSRHQAAVAMQEAEARMLDTLRLQLYQEKAAARAKAAAAKQEALLIKAENEAKLQARRQEEQRQKQIDEDMRKERIRLLEQEERRRGTEQDAFRAKVQARVSSVSDKVLAAHQEKQQQQAWLIHKYEEDKAQEQQLKEQEARDKKQRLRQELMQAREDFLALKASRAAEARRAEAALREAEAAAHQARVRDHDQRMSIIRTKTKENRQALQTQIMDNKLGQVAREVGMTAAERQLNHRLLQQAVKAMGPKPKQMPFVG